MENMFYQNTSFFKETVDVVLFHSYFKVFILGETLGPLHPEYNVPEDIFIFIYRR